MTGSFEDWLRHICLAAQGQKVQERIELTVYLLWYIWKARCVWQFEDHKWEAWEIVHRAVSEWQEFQQCSQPAVKSVLCGKVKKAGQLQRTELCQTKLVSMWLLWEDRGRVDYQDSCKCVSCGWG